MKIMFKLIIFGGIILIKLMFKLKLVGKIFYWFFGEGYDLEVEDCEIDLVIEE